jgi:hypothetical protein
VELLVAFIVGMIVMDLMWAWRLGLVQTVYYFIKWKLFTKRPQPNFEQE